MTDLAGHVKELDETHVVDKGNMAGVGHFQQALRVLEVRVHLSRQHRPCNAECSGLCCPLPYQPLHLPWQAKQWLNMQ